MKKVKGVASTIINLGIVLLLLYWGNRYADIVFPETAEEGLDDFVRPFLREGIVLIIIGLCVKSALKKDMKDMLAETPHDCE